VFSEIYINGSAIRVINSSVTTGETKYLINIVNNQFVNIKNTYSESSSGSSTAKHGAALNAFLPHYLTVFITRCYFQGCTTKEGSGGALYLNLLESYRTLTISSCIFTKCRAVEGGGVMYLRCVYNLNLDVGIEMNNMFYEKQSENVDGFCIYLLFDTLPSSENVFLNTIKLDISQFESNDIVAYVSSSNSPVTGLYELLKKQNNVVVDNFLCNSLGTLTSNAKDSNVFKLECEASNTNGNLFIGLEEMIFFIHFFFIFYFFFFFPFFFIFFFFFFYFFFFF
jgi:hypothetical protein